MKKQQGIALIQVLLITAILTVLALYLTSTAKDQVKVAQWADDKASALIALHNAETKLVFTLLTTSKQKNIPTNSLEKISTKWNFFNKTFAINSMVNAKIQDQSALIHAHFPDVNLLKPLLMSHGKNVNEANAIVDNLLDWQDLDNIPRINGDESLNALQAIRNGALPDVHDFYFINGLDTGLSQLLAENTTLYGKGFFNPMNASKELLAAITNVAIAEQIIQLRESRQLSNSQFSQLTGIVENEKILLYPSNVLEISLVSQVGISVVKKKIIIELTPYANEYQSPINILSNRG